MIEDCTAVILAGGDSTRMQRDKASLSLHGKPLFEHVTTVLLPLFPRVVASVRTPRADLVLPQVCDANPDGGPLAGLVAAFESIDTDWLFLTACDMPFVSPALLEFLASQRSEHQAVVPVVQEHLQPLAAFYARSCLDTLRAIEAGNGKRSLCALLERLDVLYIDEVRLREYDPQLRSFFDLDTPEDFAAAGSME